LRIVDAPSVGEADQRRRPAIHTPDGGYGFPDAQLRIVARARARPGMTDVIDASTQKPVAHFCGRVLGETNHFEQNTMVDRTGQAGFEFFIHRWPGLILAVI